MNVEVDVGIVAVLIVHLKTERGLRTMGSSVRRHRRRTSDFVIKNMFHNKKYENHAVVESTAS